ncbi:MAG: hypothetical protein PW735_06360 [Acidobacteriaceae bacterium]|nr:hypothetical protein [Acidobacteriaceae bacterium]
MIGFQLRALQMTGLGVPTARITFGVGLNVISGASDTGKSFLFHAIDYMFGASSLDLVPEARPYSTIELEIESDAGSFLLARGVSGGGFELRNLSEPDSPTTLLGERLVAGDPENISSFLLKLSGFEGKKVRKNVENELQNLSFRNLARMVMVDEEEIIKKTSPVHGGEGTQKTAESNTFKLFLTGQDDSALVRQKKQAVAKAELEGQLLLLEKLIDDYRKELGDKAPSQGDLEDQLTHLEASIAAAEVTWRQRRDVLNTQLEVRRTLVEAQRGDRNRAEEVNGLVARFQLLDSHYLSDIARLDALWEAGSLFPPLSVDICPLCGSPQNSHTHEHEQLSTVDVQRVRESCAAEKAKIELLRRELALATEELVTESTGLRTSIKERVALWKTVNQEIDQVLQVSVSEAEGEYNKFVNLRYEVKEQIAIYGRIANLIVRQEKAQQELSSIKPAKRVAAELPAASINDFTEVFKEILSAWRFPVAGTIAFDTQQEDFFIGIRRRREQGKGSRALTHAAFTIALMKYCAASTLPHPGLVVLDSPLITYRDRDEGDGDLSQEVRLRLKDEFYRDLAARSPDQQLIIFENEEPSPDTQTSIVFHHFTGDPALERCGFFPVTAVEGEATGQESSHEEL